MKYQVTLTNPQGHYKAVSALVDYEPKGALTKADVSAIKQKGIIKICTKRGWTKRELTKYGYTKVKARVYDKEKIDKENAERYEKIKKERGWA